MRSRVRSEGRGLLCAGLCVLATLGPTRAQSPSVGADVPTASSADRAIELYDEGRYPDARRMLEQLDATGSLSGPLLYRLYYCQNLASAPEAPATLNRAVARLEREQADSPSLEDAFYLVNAYTNSGRGADAHRVAADATTRIDSGAAAEPTDPLDQFRLAKLYADQNQSDKAERWYATALPGLERTGSSTAYVQWAARYLADATFSREEYTEAEAYLARLTTEERPSVVDLDRLAVCRARIGMYAEAAKTWRRIVPLDPANADRARYASRLAELASRLTEFSVAAPDGRLWTQLTPADLEAILAEQTTAVRAVQQEGSDWKSLDPAVKKELQSRLDRAEAIFVGAGLEYVLQGHSIREAAFSGGFAPLIFHDREWQLPLRVPGVRKPAL